jgi:nitrate/TMAO reductase-like tetraheme cytochrome c subunit
MQRIGGTYDFFNFHLDKYKRHLQARKIVLSNITATIDKNKISKAHPIMMLKEYFKDYSSLSSEFHERCYKFELPQREEDDNKMVNLRIELKIGFEKLFNLRRQTGN